jgi:LacI family transcriptional regulator
MSFTTKDLARVCGVSLGTIDRAFRNRPGIKTETRDRILAAALEHGYKPNILARNLKNRKTNEVGLIVHDLENEFFAQLVNAVQEIAWEKNFFIQIAISRRDEKRERAALEHMAGRNVDGILLFPASSGEGFDAFLHSLDRPIVTIANKVSPSWPFVGLSDREVMRELTERVIAKGYQRLVFVGPLHASIERVNLYEIEERYAGFLQAAQAAAVESALVGSLDYLGEISRLDLGKKRTAILCCSDIFALEILESLHARGLESPRDAGLAGFDSINALRFIRPRLTTVEYPIQRMGEIAFSLLVDRRAEGEGIPFIELEPKILWGETI